MRKFSKQQHAFTELVGMHSVSYVANGADCEQPFFGIFTYTLPHAELVQPEDSIFTSFNITSFSIHVDPTTSQIQVSAFGTALNTT